MFDVQRRGLSKKQSLMRLEKAKILKTAQSVKIFAGPHCKSIKYNITLSNIACMSWANIQSELFQAQMLYSWTDGAPHFPASAAAGSAVGGAGGHYFCVHNKVVLMSALISKAINGSFGAFLSTLFPLLTLSLCSQQCALFIIHTHVKFYEKYLFCVIFQLEMSLFSPLLSDTHCVNVTFWPVQCSGYTCQLFFAQNKIKW